MTDTTQNTKQPYKFQGTSTTLPPKFVHIEIGKFEAIKVAWSLLWRSFWKYRKYERFTIIIDKEAK